MITIEAQATTLEGTHYEVGFQLGKMVAQDDAMKLKHLLKGKQIEVKHMQKMQSLFDQWCPGLNEELQGFADALKVTCDTLFFYDLSYTIPKCSQIAILSKDTKENKPLLARNYEYSYEIEDFCLMKTCIHKTYMHMGTSMLLFGRDDGMNEHGLAVTMSSCGMPVVDLPNMKAPNRKGLQYWVVVRAILENCKDVDEAVAYLQGMPIAFNMNMMLLDTSGRLVLFQTMDGQCAFKRIDHNHEERQLYATNHSVLPQLMYLEPQIFVHSKKRYEYIETQLRNDHAITRAKLKEILLNKYPTGLCFHHFKDGFGTLKSMIISPIDGTIELCWGGREENHWRTYDMKDAFIDEHVQIELHDEKMAEQFFRFCSRSNRS